MARHSAIKEGFLDNLRKATGTKTNLGGIAAGIGGVAGGGIAGNFIWPGGPGAAIGALGSALSLASDIKNADKLDADKLKQLRKELQKKRQARFNPSLVAMEAASGDAFENAEPLDEGVGKMIIRGLLGSKSRKRSSSSSRRSAPKRQTRRSQDQEEYESDDPRDYEPRDGQYRDPVTGNLTPHRWKDLPMNPTAVAQRARNKMDYDDRRQAEKAAKAQAHHDANFSDEAQRDKNSRLRDYYKKNPNVGEIVHFPKMKGKTPPAWAKKLKNEDINEGLISRAKKWLTAKSRKAAVYDQSKASHSKTTRPIDKLNRMSNDAHKRGDEKKSTLYWKMGNTEIKRVMPRVKSIEGRMAAVNGGNRWIPNSPNRPGDLKYFKGNK